MLIIRRAVLDEIVAHAHRDAPKEACGYLAESAGVIGRAFQLTNTDDSSEHFRLEPKQQFAAVRQMRKDGIQLRAVYHSHPATPARPSAEDIRLAYDPNVSYVIISLVGSIADVKAFEIREGIATPERISITEE